MRLSVPRFRNLRTRLAVLYAGLFAAAMICVSLALYVVTQNAAQAQVQSELVASGTVFDRLWQQRSAQMQDAASLLARDFGFREAIATGDQRTAASALDNLKRRMGVDMVFVVNIDGRVTGIADPALRAEAAALWTPLDDGQMRGVATFGGEARHLVAAPIMAPALSGWVVFAANLDRDEMRQLERLSAIPLKAGVYQRASDGKWFEASGHSRFADHETSRFIDRALRAGLPDELATASGPAIALAKPLRTFAGAPDAVLVTRYPVAQAIAPYRPLQLSMAIVGLLGLVGMILATWRMTLTITRPISLLDKAAERLASGETVIVEVTGEDELARLAGSFNHMAAEIAERERRITHLAFNDVLTGLPNRALFQEHLDFQLRTLDRRGSREQLALFCLDLDDFKSINDTLGHPIGDALLRQISDRLAKVAGDCFVARIGGDEFVIVHPLEGDRLAPDQFARNIIEAIEAPASIDGHEIVPGASIGIALAPLDGTDVETLLSNADLALYRAKEAGRRTWCFFEQSLNARAQARRVIENDLRHALANGEFELYFQPLFDLAQNRIGAFEALLRWNHPQRGMVSPTEFIPVAEDTGMIVQIGAWVMREACRQAASWPGHVRVAVNVSSVQFRRPGLSEIIVQALTSSGLAPNRLEIEITESLFLDGNDALDLLHGLRVLGVRIALDDFGTGYSSLSYLQRFPFDKIKIDRSFIQDLLTRPGASAIVRAITDLARALGMETTAEGVEETEQLSELRLHGCTSIQGYLFSRPVSALAVSDLLGTADYRGVRAA
jgi:diguanylate cyclase (GGDEF)-like protein